MAKGEYIGIGDVARKIKKKYIGVDGLARKIKKEYMGVNGVARQIFSGGVPLDSVAEICSMTVVNESWCEISDNKIHSWCVSTQTNLKPTGIMIVPNVLYGGNVKTRVRGRIVVNPSTELENSSVRISTGCVRKTSGIWQLYSGSSANYYGVPVNVSTKVAQSGYEFDEEVSFHSAQTAPHVLSVGLFGKNIDVDVYIDEWQIKDGYGNELFHYIHES